LMNLGKVPASFSIDHPALTGNYVNLFSGEHVDIKRKETYSFQPGEFVVYHITHYNRHE